MGKTQPQRVDDKFAWITRAAMFLLLAVVCARCGLAEMLRDPMPVVPGQVSPPRGPGPAAGIGLDLLLWVPGLLVLLRRVLDREYRVRLPWSLWPLAGLCVWALISTTWAADKFAALVNAYHLIGAAGVMFAAVLLVRGPRPRSTIAATEGRGVRLVCGAALGIMLMLLANGVNKRLVDTPESIRQWYDPNSPNSRFQYMKDHGLAETDFQFMQIEKKLLGGELTGFSASANTYAAMIAVGLVVMFGIVAQHRSDGRKWGWLVAGAVGLVAVYVLRYTHSRQAAMTTVLGLLALLLMAWKGAWLSARAKSAYWAGVVVFVLGAAALAGYGMRHGSLGDRSLTMRWYYWTGATRILADRPLTGVGWANFGDYYPAVRVAQATEEVQDPHNVFMRALAELGIVGGMLLTAWLMLLFREMTRPGSAKLAGEVDGRDACATQGTPLPWAIGVAAAAGVINMLAGHDFTQNAAWLELQAIYSLGTAVLLAMSILATTGVGWPVKWDEGSSQWLLCGLVAAAGIFFVHNLVDFAWSEPAPLCFFALLAGTAVGARGMPAEIAKVDDCGHHDVSRKSPTRPRWAIATTCGVAAAMWLAGVVWVWRPVYVAEDRAAEADARLRAASPGSPGSGVAIDAAADGYARAFEMMPLNADYRMRQAQVEAWRGDRAAAIAACEEAIRVNPRQAKYQVFRTEIELSGARPEADVVKRAMESAIALDPRQVFLHIRYGDALLKLGDQPGARREYARALALDDALPEKEPKRLPAAKRKELEQKAAEGNTTAQ